MPMSSIEPSGYSLPMANVTQLNSYRQVVLCVLDSLTGSWLKVFQAPLCFTDLDESLVNRAKNTLEGVADIAHITAGFAFMFFLYYMVKLPEKDVHNHCNIFGWKGPPTLREAVKNDPMLPYHLANAKVVQPDSADILITAEKMGLDVPFGSFYVTKEAYNRIAKQHHFQQVK